MPDAPLTLAIIAPGAMGSALARRVIASGAIVLTSTHGRGAATCRRAREAGMVSVEDEAIVGADIILSVVPPAEALGLAHRLSAPLARAEKKPIYVDCNAVNVATIAQIAGVIVQTGAPFVDAAIIGFPPKPDTIGPAFYVSGSHGGALALLCRYGVDIRVMDQEIGAASALKMCYAGLAKGLTGLGALMAMAAARTGSSTALRAELAHSLPEIAQRLDLALPDMVPKAYRWVAEMHEIAAFIGHDDPTSKIFTGLAAVFERIAHDEKQDQSAIQAIQVFLQ